MKFITLSAYYMILTAIGGLVTVKFGGQQRRYYGGGSEKILPKTKIPGITSITAVCPQPVTTTWCNNDRKLITINGMIQWIIDHWSTEQRPPSFSKYSESFCIV